MSVTQETIVINEGLQERRRTTSTGTKSRYTVTVDAEPILHEFSQTHLGKGPAEAIADELRKQIKGITEIAKPSTLLQRQRGKQALERGAAWAKRRYSGGRTGEKPPSGAVRLFNDSGRLADGVVAQQNTKEKNWTINVPANRLDPSTFRNQADFVAMVERLRSLCSVLTKPMQSDAVRDAVAKGIRDTLIREMKRTADLRVARAKAVLALLGF